MKTYVLLDKSGSMSSMWGEAIGGINAFVDDLEDKSTTVTVAAFDSASFDYVREDAVASDYDPINTTEVIPGALTPLLDATGKLLSRVLSEDSEKAFVVIVTDGFENCSKEYTLETVKAKIKMAEEKGYQIVFLGANFDGIGQQSQQLGGSVGATIATSARGFAPTMSGLSANVAAYASATTMDYAVDFTDEDRAKAKQ